MKKQHERELDKFRLFYSTSNDWNGFIWCKQTEQKILSGFYAYLLDKEAYAKKTKKS